MEIAVLGFAERGVRSSVVRLPTISHSTRDRTGFLALLIALAKERGFAGYPGDGANRWSAVHTADAAAAFRLALEIAPAGTRWHAVADEGIAFREIARGIGDHLGMPAESVPDDQQAAYFGAFLAGLARLEFPASSSITRRTLGWEPAHPGILADLDNGHYFATSRLAHPPGSPGTGMSRGGSTVSRIRSENSKIISPNDGVVTPRPPSPLSNSPSRKSRGAVT